MKQTESQKPRSFTHLLLFWVQLAGNVDPVVQILLGTVTELLVLVEHLLVERVDGGELFVGGIHVPIDLVLNTRGLVIHGDHALNVEEIATGTLSAAAFENWVKETYVAVTDVLGKKNVMDRRNWPSFSPSLLMMVCSSVPVLGSTVYFVRSVTPAIKGWDVGQW